MAIYQFIFWLAVLMLCAGVGVGALYWFHVREKVDGAAPSWNNGEPRQRPEAQ